MKLYTYYRSSAAYRVRIALHYKKVSCEFIAVNLLKGDQFEPDYKALNPQMRVPTLIDGDLIIGQSMAILEYLEEKYPETALLPKDPAERAEVRFIAQLIASDIHPLNNVGVLTYLKQSFHQDQQAVNDWYFHWLKNGFDALEMLLSSRDSLFCFGESVTFADVCLIPQMYNAMRFNYPMELHPKLLAIYQYCLTLEAFEQAKPENQADAAISCTRAS